MDGYFQKYFIVNKRFHDFEEFAQITKLWNLDFRQIDRSAFEAHKCKNLTLKVDLYSGLDRWILLLY